MEIFSSIKHFKTDCKTFVTIGTFDGVHLGHKKVLKKLVQNAKNKNAKTVLLTFFPHPRMVLQKDAEIKLINTIDERIALLKKTGLDYLIIQPFNEEFSQLTALQFVRNILVKKLNVAKLFIGYDHQFGKNREGDFELLKNYSETYNFKLQKISQKDINSITISSTKIRTAIENGEITKATNYLGYYFLLTGTVVSGQRIGKKLNYPTANLQIDEAYKLLPKTGVYVVKSTIENELYFGMMNIGNRPTVSGKEQTIETHFFNLNKNLYGEKIQIEVLHFLRNEIKFDSLEKLKNQLQVDKENSLNYIGTFIERNS